MPRARTEQTPLMSAPLLAATAGSATAGSFRLPTPDQARPPPRGSCEPAGAAIAIQAGARGFLTRNTSVESNVGRPRSAAVPDARNVVRHAMHETQVVNAWNVKHVSNSHPYLVEFGLTIVLVWVACLPHENMQCEALTNAVVTVLLVSAGAPVSGAHFNPALTLAFYLAGLEGKGLKMRAKGAFAKQSPWYVIIHLAAAAIGSVGAHFMSVGPDPFIVEGDRCSTVAGVASFLREPDSAANPHSIHWMRITIGSFLATFSLCFWVMYSALLVKPPLGNFGPVTVGMVIFAIVTCFGPIGGVPNPAVIFGFVVRGWICHVQESGGVVLAAYWPVQLLAGAFAGLLALDARKREEANAPPEKPSAPTDASMRRQSSASGGRSSAGTPLPPIHLRGPSVSGSGSMRHMPVIADTKGP